MTNKRKAINIGELFITEGSTPELFDISISDEGILLDTLMSDLKLKDYPNLKEIIHDIAISLPNRLVDDCGYIEFKRITIEKLNSIFK